MPADAQRQLHCPIRRQFKLPTELTFVTLTLLRCRQRQQAVQVAALQIRKVSLKWLKVVMVATLSSGLRPHNRRLRVRGGVYCGSHAASTALRFKVRF